MRTKLILVFFLLMPFFSYAQNYDTEPYMLIHSIDKDGKTKNVDNYLYEYFFDEEGFFKKIVVYKSDKIIDYYNWKNVKTKCSILYIYDVERIENGILIKNYTYGRNPIQDWKFTAEKDKEKKLRTFKIVDDILELMEYRLNEENADIVQVDFDSKNLYYYKYTKTKSNSYKDSSGYIFISKPINFTAQASIVNEKTDCCPFYISFDIVGHNILPKPEYTYINNKEKLVFKKDYLSLTGNKKTSFANQNYKLSEVKGMRKISFKDEEDKLLLKNSDFTILYHKNQKTPSFIGWNPEKPLSIVKIKNINASSFLQEKETSYKAENLLKAQLDAPWVEGVQGDGIGEYIELDKAEATGMYIVNGFVSLDRPDLYEKNNRVEYVYIEGLNSGKKIGYRLVDTAKPQYIDLEGFEKEKIKITIRNVYKGTKYQDTCISGIFLVKETK